MPAGVGYGATITLSRDNAFGLVNVMEGDSVTERYRAASGDVTMTRVTSREAFDTFRLEATGGHSREESTEVPASGDFRAYHQVRSSGGSDPA